MAADLKGAILLSRTRDERDFPLPDQPEIGIGYDRSNDLSIAFEGVSRRHARISYDGKDYWIEDSGSANGTFLNAVRLVQKERLRHLDIVTLGRRADLIFVRRSVDLSRKTRRGVLSASLEILDGLEAGSRREIPRGSVTLGRTAGNNIVADSQLVSKVHARIERTGVQLLLTDLQSANGTFVNKERIESRILRDGDEISVGRARAYRVRIEEGEVLTGDVPLENAIASTSNPSLPMDWKTHMEWSPEEAALFDRARAAMRPPTPPAKAGETAPAPKAAAKPAAAAPAVKPVPTAPKPAVLPAAPAVKPVSPKPAAPPPEAAKPDAEAEAATPKVASPAVAAPAPAEIAKPKPPEEAPAPPVKSQAPAAVPSPAAKPPAPAAPPPSPPTPPVVAAPPSPQPTPPAKPPVPMTPSAPPAKPAILPTPPAKPPSPAAADPDATRALAPAALIARVILESPARTFPLPVGTFEIGRDPGAAVRLEGSEVSRRHARLQIDGAAAVLEDLQTVNGTSVNGQRLSSPRVLADGDLIAFGNTAFRVRFAEGYPARPPEKP